MKITKNFYELASQYGISRTLYIEGKEEEVFMTAEEDVKEILGEDATISFDASPKALRRINNLTEETDSVNQKINTINKAKIGVTVATQALQDADTDAKKKAAESAKKKAEAELKKATEDFEGTETMSTNDLLINQLSIFDIRISVGNDHYEASSLEDLPLPILNVAALLITSFIQGRRYVSKNQ